MRIPNKKSTGRDNRGRFVAGNKFGRGRPPSEIEAEYLQAFNRGCDVEQFQRIVQKLAVLAESGNIAAIRLIMQHALPTQSKRLELATKSTEEYRVAGVPPEEHLREMWERLCKRVQELRKREELVSPNK